MKRERQYPSKWIWVFSGIIVGLLITVGLELSQHMQAQSVGDVEIPRIVDSEQQVASEVGLVQQLSDVFATVAEQVNPSVVTIFTETEIEVSQNPLQGSPFDQFFGEDFFNKFFQKPAPNQKYTQMGLGSGVIASPDGIIYTNNHVVDGADDIKVRLMDGREFKATVKGRDSQTDVAVISIDAKNLPAIRLGNSDKLRVGDWVLAIGSPLNPQLEHTVTAGIVSAKGRSAMGLSQYEDYIQTDAAINPGNSGGALVNLYGELVGINSAIATQNGGFMGIGFAVPVNLAKHVTKDLLEKGKVVRGWLGISIQNLTPELAQALDLKLNKGVVVSSVEEDSPADKVGLKTEDVILEFNGRALENTVELSTAVANTSPGTEVTLLIARDGKAEPVNVKLGELNPEKIQIAKGAVNVEKIGMEVHTITDRLVQEYHIDSNVHGVVITKIEPGSISSETTLQVGDVITGINRKEIQNINQFNDEIQNTVRGEDVLLYVNRNNVYFYVAFTMP